MANITPQVISTAAATPTYAAAVGPDTIVGAKHGMIVHFKNTNAAARNVTFASVVVDGEGYAVENLVVNVPLTTGDKMVLLHRAYISATGTVTLTYDAVANLTVAVFDRANV